MKKEAEEDFDQTSTTPTGSIADIVMIDGSEIARRGRSTDRGDSGASHTLAPLSLHGVWSQLRELSILE